MRLGAVATAIVATPMATSRGCLARRRAARAVSATSNEATSRVIVPSLARAAEDAASELRSLWNYRHGPGGGTRTHDRWLKRPLLYRLSYAGATVTRIAQAGKEGTVQAEFGGARRVEAERDGFTVEHGSGAARPWTSSTGI